MKIMGILFTFFIAFNVVASTNIEACNVAQSLCSSDQGCSDNEIDSQNSDSNTDASSHEHCNAHCACANVFFQFTSSSMTLIAALGSSANQPYSFAYTQAFLEGPFRPPLSKI